MRRHKAPCPQCGNRTLRKNLKDELLEINGIKVLIEFDYFTRECTDCSRILLTATEFGDIIRLLRRKEND